MGKNNNNVIEAAGTPVSAATSDLNDQIDLLSEKLAHTEKALEEKNREVEDLMAINQDLQHEIEALTAKPQVAPSATRPATKDWQALRFDLDGTVYKFSFPAVTFKDRKITAAQVAADEALQRDLLQAGSRFFRPE